MSIISIANMEYFPENPPPRSVLEPDVSRIATPQGAQSLPGFSLQPTLRFESPTRYYLLRCEPDLLGDLVLSRYWGRKGARLGGQMHQAMPSLEAALRQVDRIIRTRLSHGYHEIRG